MAGRESYRAHRTEFADGILAIVLCGLVTACTRAPTPGRDSLGLPFGSARATADAGAGARTVFTDTALFRQLCEVSDSTRPDYSHCVLKEQPRLLPRRPPPALGATP